MDVPPSLPPLPLASPFKPRFALVGVIVAWLVIAASIGYTLWSHAEHTGALAGSGVQPNALLDMMARYVVGLHELTKQAPSRPGSTPDLTKSLQSLGGTPADQFRVEIVRGALVNQRADPARLAHLAEKDPSLVHDVQAASHAETLVPEEWNLFVQRHGWVARLARAQANHWENSDWPVMRSEALRTMTAYIALALFCLGGLVVGLIALVLILREWGQGRLPVRLARPEPRPAGAFIEAFAIYLGAFVLVGALAPLAKIPPAARYAVVAPFVALAIFWPRWRGVDGGSWRQSMGLHRGAGVFCEIGYGMLGWFAGLPLLAAALVLTTWIRHRTGGSLPHHPIMDELMHPGWARWGQVALATLWAPLTEETLFRGALFPALARWLRWIPGALLGSFLFAVVHPQGWLGVPAIMAIAITMSALRSFRGSLIAPMAAHALNNGLLCALLIAAS